MPTAAVTAPTATNYPGVRKRKSKSGDVYYFRYVDENGVETERRYGLGTAREASAARIEALKRVARIRAGLEQAADPYSQESPATAIEQFVEFLTHKGDSANHVRMVESYLTSWAEDAGVRHLRHATPDQVNAWLRSHADWSPRSYNYARSSVLSLFRWAEAHNRIARNPMRSGTVPARKADGGRRVRRAMSLAEWNALLGSLAASGPWSGERRQRRAFYMLVGATGLRWTEAMRVRWDDVDLDAGVLTVPAHQSKTGGRAELPLHAAVVEALRDLPTGTDRVFHECPSLRTWKLDLERAKIEFADDRGHIAGRGCLRKSFATWLYHNGVDLRDAQRLMRHSDPKLTASVYTDVRMADLGRAVDGAVRIGAAAADARLQASHCRSTTCLITNLGSPTSGSIFQYDIA